MPSRRQHAAAPTAAAPTAVPPTTVLPIATPAAAPALADATPGSSSSQAAVDDPHDDVLVGHIQGAWGVRGEVKVVAQSTDAAALLHTSRWRLVLDRAGSHAAALLARPFHDVKARRHGNGVVARIDGVDDRDAAQALVGTEVRIPRSAFPRTAHDEYYWVDLIGCRVVNREGEALGEVTGLVDTGVHSVLRIEARGASASTERLVPFVSAYVDDVDLSARTIRVDWGLDY